MTEVESIRVVLSLPSKALSTNAKIFSRGGRMAESVAAKKYRQAAWAIALSQFRPSMPWTRATAQLTFYWSNRLRRDLRNAEAMMKPAYDGVVDAGVITDDWSGVLRHKETVFGLDRSNPRVEMRVINGWVS